VNGVKSIDAEAMLLKLCSISLFSTGIPRQGQMVNSIRF
jgi:hypothetical protein